jgi:hypothetical protein
MPDSADANAMVYNNGDHSSDTTSSSYFSLSLRLSMRLGIGSDTAMAGQPTARACRRQFYLGLHRVEYTGNTYDQNN